MSLHLCGMKDPNHEVYEIGFAGGSIEVIGSGAVEHWQLGRMVNFFISGLEETNENLKLELSAVSSRIEVDSRSAGVATATSAKVAHDGSSQLADDVFGCSL